MGATNGGSEVIHFRCCTMHKSVTWEILRIEDHRSRLRKVEEVDWRLRSSVHQRLDVVRRSMRRHLRERSQRRAGDGRVVTAKEILKGTLVYQSRVVGQLDYLSVHLR